MGGINDQNVRTSLHQDMNPLFVVGQHADRGAHQEPSPGVLGRSGIPLGLLDVLDGDETLEVVFFVHDRELLDLVLVEQFFRLFEADLSLDRDEVFLGHGLRYGPVHIAFEPQIAVGENSHQFAVHGDRDPGYPVVHHELHGIADFLLGAHGDGVDDHPALGLLDFVDLHRLRMGAHVLVNDPDPAFPRHGNGCSGLGDSVHGRADKRYVQSDISGEQRADIRHCRRDGRPGRKQQHIVKCQGVVKNSFHTALLLTECCTRI